MGAEKQFPTMLISPGLLYIQIRLAKMEQAFQATMDPCRRIFGTYRDYVPNIGFKSYYATASRKQVLALDLMTKNTSNISTYKNAYKAYTSHAARGKDFAWNGILGIYPPIQSDPSTTGPLYNNCCRSNIFWNNYGVNLDGYAITEFSDPTNDAAKKIPNMQGFNEGLSTELPKPQYVPITKPWLNSGNLLQWNLPSSIDSSSTQNYDKSIPWNQYQSYHYFSCTYLCHQ